MLHLLEALLGGRIAGVRVRMVLRASLRYAFLISSCDAVFATPSVS